MDVAGGLALPHWGLAACSQFDILGVRYKSVNLALVNPNRLGHNPHTGPGRRGLEDRAWEEDDEGPSLTTPFRTRLVLTALLFRRAALARTSSLRCCGSGCDTLGL